ncbi:MAG TPA: cupin domain-containing protein [Vitreimonas sp.]|uniref:cupin domain-containing protein n=1 Tax=Vitreimonas sp. TaxID=3069702 RepID=UPI002D267918|nr:cupin domain-containing protein [Vitreimonas sp.]HYD86659.1 cupin domain-containing protein [Vitreimonas sp.]
MSGKLHPIRGEGAPDFKPIDADRIVDGAPMTETRLDYERDGTYVGEWAADVGAWRVRYDEWEFCHMLEGVCELTPEGGGAQRYQAGDSFVIEAGFVGVWRVVEPMRKRFVVRIG